MNQETIHRYCQNAIDYLKNLPKGSSTFDAIDAIIKYSEQMISGEEQAFIMELYVRSNLDPYGFYSMLKVEGDKTKLPAFLQRITETPREKNEREALEKIRQEESKP